MSQALFNTAPILWQNLAKTYRAEASGKMLLVTSDGSVCSPDGAVIGRFETKYVAAQCLEAAGWSRTKDGMWWAA
jgi:hypothetical protein